MGIKHSIFIFSDFRGWLEGMIHPTHLARQCFWSCVERCSLQVGPLISRDSTSCSEEWAPKHETRGASRKVCSRQFSSCPTNVWVKSIVFYKKKEWELLLITTLQQRRYILITFARKYISNNWEEKKGCFQQNDELGIQKSPVRKPLKKTHWIRGNGFWIYNKWAYKEAGPKFPRTKNEKEAENQDWAIEVDAVADLGVFAP